MKDDIHRQINALENLTCFIVYDIEFFLPQSFVIALKIDYCFLLCTDVCGQEEGSCGPDLCWCPCRRGEVTKFFTLSASNFFIL